MIEQNGLTLHRYVGLERVSRPSPGTLRMFPKRQPPL